MYAYNSTFSHYVPHETIFYFLQFLLKLLLLSLMTYFKKIRNECFRSETAKLTKRKSAKVCTIQPGPNHKLLNKIKELAADAPANLNQSNQELLQKMRDGITINLSREYKTPKHNVSPNSKLLFGEDHDNRIKLLQASNKYITPNNSRYYRTYSPNFSKNQENSNSKNFKDFSRRNSTKTLFEKKPQHGQGHKQKLQHRN